MTANIAKKEIVWNATRSIYEFLAIAQIISKIIPERKKRIIEPEQRSTGSRSPCVGHNATV